MKICLPPLGPDLPTHPFTGLTALGLRRNGAPIWPIKGGAPDEGEDDATGGDDPDEDDDTGSDDLGDPGKQALDRMKTERNTARKGLRSWSALAREFGAKTPDDVRNLLNGKTTDGGDQLDPEQIRREARAEADREVARERLLDKIEAKAKGFADPADAAALLLQETEADDFLDGTKVDGDAIAEALEDLLKRKPYLAATTTTDVRRPKPDRSQGNRGGKPVSARDQAMAEIEKRFGKKPATT